MQKFYELYKNVKSSKLELEQDPLDDLRSNYKNCTRCNLCKPRIEGVAEDHKTVLGAGSIRPKIMFIGLAPSQEDCRNGSPFSDVQGKCIHQLIDTFATNTSLKNEIYMTNLVICHGDVEEENYKACYDRLEKEIMIVSPEIIVALGEKTAQLLLDVNEPISNLRLKRHLINFKKYYPLYITESPQSIFFLNGRVKNTVAADIKFIFDDLKSLC